MNNRNNNDDCSACCNAIMAANDESQARQAERNGDYRQAAGFWATAAREERNAGNYQRANFDQHMADDDARTAASPCVIL